MESGANLEGNHPAIRNESGDNSYKVTLEKPSAGLGSPRDRNLFDPPHSVLALKPATMFHVEHRRLVCGGYDVCWGSSAWTTTKSGDVFHVEHSCSRARLPGSPHPIHFNFGEKS